MEESVKIIKDFVTTISSFRNKYVFDLEILSRISNVTKERYVSILWKHFYEKPDETLLFSIDQIQGRLIQCFPTVTGEYVARMNQKDLWEQYA